MPIEYRVKWKRAGLDSKRVKYTSRKFAERRVALLTSTEPWVLFGKNPDEYECCSGYECGCGGETVREFSDRMRADMPALEYAVIEQRQVGPWVVSPSPHKEGE